VLGVVDDALARRGEERHRLGDHREVLLARDPHDLLEVQPPGLADDGHDRGEAAASVCRPSSSAARSARRGHPEGDDARRLERLVLEQAEELELLRVRRGEARLDVAHAELVERVGDADLLLGRERHAPRPACPSRRVAS
jgi:hypothetical protein